MSARIGFAWDVRDDAQVSLVTLRGSIDEDANLTALGDELRSRSKIRFDLSGIQRVNSCGVREWVNFIEKLTGELEFEKCPPVVVAQLNMVRDFAGNGLVRSVQAPYVCEDCGTETEIEIDLRSGVAPTLGAPSCASCGSTMEFDDLADSYFAFLNNSGYSIPNR